MNILIVSATTFEVAPLAAIMKAQPGEAGGKLKRFVLNGHYVDVLYTGIGMTSTAFYLGKHIPGHYDLAINLGLAGSFNRNLEIGSVVNVYCDRFAELGAENGDDFLTLAEMQLPDDNAFLFANGELVNSSFIRSQVVDELPKVNGITVNKVHGNERTIEETFRRFHPTVESMEGAAFLYCCKIEHLPCVQVRAISNYVERRNKNAWNIPLAISNLNKKVIEIINSLS
jgi:futalosine hydrolase